MSSAPVSRAATLMDVSNVQIPAAGRSQLPLPDAKERFDIEVRLDTMLRKDGYHCKWRGCSCSFACWDVLRKHVQKAHCSSEALTKATKRSGRPGTSSRPPKIHACQWEPCHAGTKFPSLRELMEHVVSAHIEGEKNLCPLCGQRSIRLWEAVNHIFRNHDYVIECPLLLPSPLPYTSVPPIPYEPLFRHDISFPPVRPSTKGERTWAVPVESNALVLPEKPGKRLRLALEEPVVPRIVDVTPPDPRPVEVQCDIDWDEPRIGWEVMLAKLS